MDSFFEDLVKECRKNNSAQVIHNASMDHAKVLIENLLDVANEKEEIKLVSDSLFDPFYDQLVPNIERCFQKGCKVDVIVLDSKKDLSKSKFANVFLKNKDKGTITKAKKDSAMAFPNFIVIGNNRYRFEEDKINKKAVACFNSEEVGTTLVNVFKKIKNNITAA